MSSSYIVFLLTTIGYYYLLKPKISLDILNNPENYQKYISNVNYILFLFLTINIILQFFTSYFIISGNCINNTASESFSSAAMTTILPWLIIFTAIILILIFFPGFKFAFSNTIGYFYISSSANKLLNELMTVNSSIKNKIDNTDSITPQEHIKLQETAESIMKLFGNVSVLINEIVPENFINYWKIIQPLFKEQYQKDDDITLKLKNELLDLVISRDNVGECLWYIYVGILIISIVQYNISNKGCAITIASMEANYQTYLDTTDTINNQNTQASSNVYVY
jgi:hypothetical protein